MIRPIKTRSIDDLTNQGKIEKWSD